jgi:GMP reductase
MIRFIKEIFPDSYLIVGNGDNPEWIKWLENLGVDCAKINIGVSKSCRTRQYTGFGSSTVTDLIKCSETTKNIKLISDGGLTIDDNNEVLIGDAAKAIRFGADYIMSGALFKNCLDNPAIKNGYFGNASRKAKGNTHVEGSHLKVDTNLLTMSEMIKLIEESLRSSVSYSGGRKLVDLRGCEYQILL